MPRAKSPSSSTTPRPPVALGKLLGERPLPSALVTRLQGLLACFNPRRQNLAIDLWHDDTKPVSHLAVVLADQSFLTDTVTLCARRWNLDIAELRHPVMAVSRDAEGHFEKLGGPLREALIYLQLPALSLELAEKFEAAVRTSLAAAQATVADFNAMRDRLHDERSRLAVTRAASREELQFMDWLLADHFIFLGMREYRYRPNAEGMYIQAVPGSGLGILRHAPSRAEQPVSVAKVGGHMVNHLDLPGAVVVGKAFSRAPIHRDAAMDYVSVRTLDARGQVTAEWRILGLFTSRAYASYVGDVPLLAGKMAAVRENAGFAPGSYSARVLQNILETWPRDELFLSSINELTSLALQAVEKREKMETAVLVRQAPREGAVSVQVWVPSLRYEARLRKEITDFLTTCTGGSLTDQRLEMGDAEIVRLFFRIQVNSAKKLKEKEISDGIVRLVRGWADEVQHLLHQRLPWAAAEKVWKNIGLLMSSAYRTVTAPARAVADLEVLQRLPEEGVVRFDVTGKPLILRVYRPSAQGWPLHQLLPVLASFGLKTAQEQHHQVPGAGAPVSIQVIELEGELPPGAGAAAARVAALATRALNGQAEVDTLNSLILLANIDVEAVAWLRAWAACLQQADRRFNAALTHGFLVRNSNISSNLVELFRARLQPGLSAAARGRAKALSVALKAAIAALPDADDEQIGVYFHTLILAMVRTNAWQAGAAALAFKLDGQALECWPKPLVYKEIFVYHPEVEGIHLRGGPVARGGLRHSDRHYDYRIEILGLQQAQQRKNSIIVPGGAKGGFVQKTLAECGAGVVHERALVAHERSLAPLACYIGGASARMDARAAYRVFVSALLSVTDTYDAKGKVVHPRDVVCLDSPREGEGDPYLVVAADKGTATYSDLANSLAAGAAYWDGVTNGFWLGDAFASGGSNGYDHKAMAITARGAWLSVLHHLKALDMTPSAKRPLVMAGIGDPSGDVFGNGLVREPHAHLLAAFNHRHIFIDPAPDLAAAFAERRRLLAETKGWDAYNPKLISAGGGVWPRSAKRIELSARAQALLGLKKKEAAPAEVIRAILKAPVDVLWNGGIGTYIRASDERDDEVGDKANEAVRVAAKDVRARIVGEGGNLGVTPRGRVELSLRGVRLNSDALDNSAGVSTSDHEVNLKILLGLDLAASALKGCSEPDSGLLREGKKEKLWVEARNEILKKCAGDVAEAVLADNTRQNLAISLEQAAPASAPLNTARDLFALQQSLLKKGVLSEAVDNLPTLPQLLARDGGPHGIRGYTRPELAGLMAGTKLVLREELLKPELKDLREGPVGRAALAGYFPAGVPGHMLALAPRHPLAAEITATVLANRVVNRLGLLAVPHLCADLGISPAEALRAVMAVEDWVAGDAFWREMDRLEALLPLPALLAAYQRVRAVVLTLAAWQARAGELLDPATAREALALLPQLVGPAARKVLTQRQKGWRDLGYTPALAERLSLLSPAVVVPDAVTLAAHGKRTLKDTLALQLSLGEALDMPLLMRRTRAMSLGDGWSRQAVLSMVLELLHSQRHLTAHLLQHKTDLKTWQKKHAAALARYRDTVASVVDEKNLSVAMLSVVVGRLRELAA